ncbi:hypothetical protein HaLaN_27899, partial [Haematococcus lacustris]
MVRTVVLVLPSNKGNLDCQNSQSGRCSSTWSGCQLPHRKAVHEPEDLPFTGRELTATSDYSPDTHIAVGVDPGVTQAIKAAHAQQHPVTGH